MQGKGKGTKVYSLDSSDAQEEGIVSFGRGAKREQFYNCVLTVTARSTGLAHAKKQPYKVLVKRKKVEKDWLLPTERHGGRKGTPLGEGKQTTGKTRSQSSTTHG